MELKVSTGESFLSRSCASSDGVSKAHCHDCYEIYYMIEGNRRYFINEKIFDVRTGDVIVIPEQTIHKVTKCPNRKSGEMHSRYVIYPTFEMIPNVFKHFIKHYHYRHSPRDSRKIKESFEEIEAEVNSPRSFSPQLIQASLIRILGVLADNSDKTARTGEVSHHDLLMEEVCHYIMNHFNEPLTLDELSRKYRFNKSYFSVLFKESTGFNFLEYLTNLRIVHAANLLKETNLPITEISDQCGYNDSNYFAAVFKKIFCVTPIKYRKHFREKT